MLASSLSQRGGIIICQLVPKYFKVIYVMSKCLFLILLVSSFVRAESEFRVSGFGTIGVVTTDSDDFGYRADFSKTGGVFENDIDFAEGSNLGLQFDIIASDEIDFVVQAVYRDQKKLDLDSAINLAFVRYAPNPNWSFRIGRTAYDLFLLTEYRDIGYAYTWAHIPSEIYGIIPHRYLDGVDVTFSKPIGDITFAAKLFYGENEFPLTAYGSSSAGLFRLDNTIGLALDFHSMNWEVAINRTRLKFDSQVSEPLVEALVQMDALVPNFSAIWPNSMEFARDIEVDNRDGIYTSISGQYRFDSVTVISELSKISSESLGVPGVESGYLSGIYHYNAHNFFTSLAFSDSEEFKLEGINLAALEQVPFGLEAYEGAELLLNYFTINQKTFSLGWRWDFDPNMSFKLQLDHTRIDKGGSTFWQPPTKDYTTLKRTGHVNALFANVSFLY